MTSNEQRYRNDDGTADQPMPCCFCAKGLDCADPQGWASKQPYGGGEIQLIFSFGSFKFDGNIGVTRFTGLICDECAEKMIPLLVKEPDNA